jgi:DNA-binding transcriptional MerR regulator
MYNKITVDEVINQYSIPKKILEEYHSFGLCDAVREVMGDWKYDEEDMERLSMIMTLHDIGFSTEEVETYMKLMIAGSDTETERMRMLNKKRTETLDDIHFREKQLERMDYLRYEMRGNRKEEK